MSHEESPDKPAPQKPFGEPPQEANNLLMENQIEVASGSVPKQLTLKHAIVLVSLTLLIVSAVAPLFLILSSLCIFFIPFLLKTLAFMVRDLGGIGAEAWLGMANALATAAVTPFVGAMSDLVGRRWIALSGLALVMVGTLIIGLAERMNVAIGGTALLGVGAGLAEMIGFAGALETIPVRKRGKYLGILFLLYLPVAGCPTFAQLYSTNTWRWGAWICIILAAINFILILVFYHPPPRSSSLGLSNLEIIRRIDFVGGFLSLAGFALFLMGLLWAGYTYPWKSAPVITTIILGVILLLVFIWWERRTLYPIFPRSLFVEKLTASMTLLITALGGANFWSLSAFWPLECQSLYGSDAIKVSLYVLPLGLGLLLGIILINTAVTVFRGHNRALMMFSSTIMAAGMGGLAAVNQNTPALGVGLTFLGSIGIGGTIQPAVTMLTIISPDESIATITAASITVRLIGATIGYAINFNIFETKLTEVTTAVINAATKAGLPSTEINPLLFALSTKNATELEHFPPQAVAAAEAAAVGTLLQGFRVIYLVSIVFSAGAFIASFFLRDIKDYMVDRVAVEIQ